MRGALTVGLVALLACSPGAGPGEQSDTDEPQSEVFEEPEFLDPPNDEVTIPADRTNDLELGIRGVRPGLTRVLLDEQSLGIGQGEAREVVLGVDLLRLRLSGAMVPTVHTLQLRTVSPDEVLDSEVIEITIAPSQPRDLRASRDDEVVFEADSIAAHGHGRGGVLLGLDLTTDPTTVTVARADDEGWLIMQRVTVELPDFDPGEEPRFAVSGGLRVLEAGDRLRLAWRSGVEGRSMLAADMLWPPATIQVQSVVDLARDFDDLEYGSLGRPLILGDTLVMEALLTQDVERPPPGSRTLLLAAANPDGGRFGPARRSAIGGGRDIDRIEPVRDLHAHGLSHTPGLSARAEGIRTVVYDLDASSGTLSERPSGTSDRFSALRDTLGPVHTVLGSLQGRHAFAPLLADEPQVFLRQFDDRRGGDSFDVSPGTDALSDIGDITAPVTATVIGGLAVFLIPQGPDTPVVAIISAESDGHVRALNGLACDEIAAPTTEVTFETGRISVACRRGRDVHRGTIQLVEDA